MEKYSPTSKLHIAYMHSISRGLLGFKFTLRLGQTERSPRTGIPKYQTHQIILALYLTVLKFNDILTLGFLEIQSNTE